MKISGRKIHSLKFAIRQWLMVECSLLIVKKKIQMQLKQILEKRIVILDGAMGTMVQRHKLSEEDFRGERFKNHTTSLKGCNDLLCLTQPQIIREIHEAYLDA